LGRMGSLVEVEESAFSSLFDKFFCFCALQIELRPVITKFP
jgi:hypothetical protein